MIDRRSGIDSRSEADKQLIGERRSGTDRRVHRATPSGEELALLSGASDGSCATRRVATFLELPSGKVTSRSILMLFGSSNGSNSWQALPSNPKPTRSRHCARWLARLPKRPDARVATSLVIQTAPARYRRASAARGCQKQ
jgi:hypothetical protein